MDAIDPRWPDVQAHACRLSPLPDFASVASYCASDSSGAQQELAGQCTWKTIRWPWVFTESQLLRSQEASSTLSPCWLGVGYCVGREKGKVGWREEKLWGSLETL